MPVKFTQRQLEFWQELLAPFGAHEISSADGADYLDKRILANRLDSVCGPDGWRPEYKPTARGYTCALSIRCPGSESDDWTWITKEDGAGFSGMGNYKKVWNEQTRKKEQTDEWEEDVNNDEKSAYTNAFRRAAQDAWGIGRYLYKKGIPSFLDPNAEAPFLTPVESRPAASTASSQPRPTPPSPREQAAPSSPDSSNRIEMPSAGSQVFAWAKDMERVFQTVVVDGMSREAEKQGWGTIFKSWNQAQVNTICLGVMKFLRELPTYKNQFEHLFPGGSPDHCIPTQRGSGPHTPAAAPGVNIAELRRALLDRMKALLAKQIGREPQIEEVKRVFEAVASHAKTSQGSTGEIPESLSKMTDIAWINNCIQLVEYQIANAKPLGTTEEDDYIPF